MNPILPIISGITPKIVAPDSATITWTTDQPSSSRIDYGATSSYGSFQDDPSSVTSHSVTHGVTIMRPDTTVKGVVINSTGNETGVTVNGIVATVAGNQFIAEHVPLAEGANTIAVTATDTAGSMATSTVSVSAATTGHYIRVSPIIVSGIAPLETVLRIDGTFSITNTTISASGPVQPEVTATATDEYTVKLIAEGVYTFMVSATGPDGNNYQDSIAITVLNRDELDKLLKAKWEGMKTALRANDINGALNYLGPGIRFKFNRIFGLIGAELPAIVDQLQNINLISVRGDVAKCYLKKIENGTEYAYFVYFMKDETGFWIVETF